MENVDYGRLFELVLKVVDFIKSEIVKIEEDASVNNNPEFIVKEIVEFLSFLKSDSDVSHATKPIKEDITAKNRSSI